MKGVDLYLKVRRAIQTDGLSVRAAARRFGIDPRTIKKMVMFSVPPGYVRQKPAEKPKLGPHTASIRRLLDENATLPPMARLSAKDIYQQIRAKNGFRGSYSIVADYARPIVPEENYVWESVYDLLTSLGKKRAIDFLVQLSHNGSPIISTSRTEQFFRDARRVCKTTTKPDQREKIRQTEIEWMRTILQKEARLDSIRSEVGDVPGLSELLEHIYEGRLSDRNRSIVVLANRHRIRSGTVCAFLGIDKKTYRKYLRIFRSGGCDALFKRQTKSNRKFDNEALKQAVFGLLHQPPSEYGINRTTWIMPDLARVLREKGSPVCPEVIRRITKTAGYKWRKARIVLTSSDPDYSAKLGHIRTILSQLGSDEAFFSIDEFGPFAIKMKQGRMLDPPGKHRVVPQWQKSKGCLIMTAALELSSNQVTHFYSDAKNTTEMIRMMELLLDRYHDRRKIYLSWDAASWHISKKLQQRIDEHNVMAASNRQPLVETAPLPAGAQFLNVIESIFSGMARAVIHNSNYPSIDHAKAAFDRYFDERNTQFRLNPKRAGKKIWGKEREPASFSEANNCKDPRYR